MGRIQLKTKEEKELFLYKSSSNPFHFSVNSHHHNYPYPYLSRIGRFWWLLRTNDNEIGIGVLHKIVEPLIINENLINYNDLLIKINKPRRPLLKIKEESKSNRFSLQIKPNRLNLRIKQ